jgi:hypothetical protein
VIRHHRRPAQTLAIAAVAMVCMLGMVSLVIDLGIYFVIQHELQNAADAAALDAVWYFPACTSDMEPYGCQPSFQGPAQGCSAAPCSAAVSRAQANLSIARELCQGPNASNGQVPVTINAYPSSQLQVPTLGAYVVTLSCDAPHWFAQVLPGVKPTMHIQVAAAAVLGWAETNGNVTGLAPTLTPTPLPAPVPTPTPQPPARLVARLIL